MKAMIMNQSIPELVAYFEKYLFAWGRREPTFNIQFALKVRRRQYGDIETCVRAEPKSILS